MQVNNKIGDILKYITRYTVTGLMGLFRQDGFCIWAGERIVLQRSGKALKRLSMHTERNWTECAPPQMF